VVESVLLHLQPMAAEWGYVHGVVGRPKVLVVERRFDEFGDGVGEHAIAEELVGLVVPEEALLLRVLSAGLTVGQSLLFQSSTTLRLLDSMALMSRELETLARLLLPVMRRHRRWLGPCDLLFWGGIDERKGR